MQTIQVGTSVRVKSNNRIRHAIVTGVTSQTVLDLRIGTKSNGANLSSVSKVAQHSGLDGWYQSR